MQVRLRALAALAAIFLGAAAPAPLAGAFALQGGSAEAQAHLVASDGPAGALDRELDMWLTAPGSTAALAKYDVDMTKLLHLIVVDDRLHSFAHVHPVLGSDGHFRIEHRFPAPGLYHIYADSEPAGLGQQVFRYDLAVGDAPAAATGTRPLPPSASTASAGPYRVTLSSTSIAANGMSMLDVHVKKNGKPASDLHPYLGALAHAVFIDARDLTYVHVHPVPLSATGGMAGMAGMGDMPGMAGMKMPEASPLPDSATSSPDMALHVAVREAGTYALWLQFRGGGDLHVAAFTITAR